MRNRQHWHSSKARWWNNQDHGQPNPGPRADASRCTIAPPLEQDHPNLASATHLQVPVPVAPDEEDAAAAGAVGRPLAPEEPLLGHQHARRLHAAHELVRGEEHGVLLEHLALQTRNLDIWREGKIRIKGIKAIVQ